MAETDGTRKSRDPGLAESDGTRFPTQIVIGAPTDRHGEVRWSRDGRTASRSFNPGYERPKVDRSKGAKLPEAATELRLVVDELSALDAALADDFARKADELRERGRDDIADALDRPHGLRHLVPPRNGGHAGPGRPLDADRDERIRAKRQKVSRAKVAADEGVSIDTVRRAERRQP